jgi:hypothetical protein
MMVGDAGGRVLTRKATGFYTCRGKFKILSRPHQWRGVRFISTTPGAIIKGVARAQ